VPCDLTAAGTCAATELTALDGAADDVDEPVPELPQPAASIAVAETATLVTSSLSGLL